MRRSRASISCSARFEPAELHAQQEAVVLLDLALECQHQVVMLAAQPPLGEVSHLFGCGVALDQSLEHGSAGHAEDVGGDTA